MIASHPNFANFQHLLSPGWIPGRKFDNTDQQYASFRDNLTYLFLLIVLHPFVRHASEHFYLTRDRPNATAASHKATASSSPSKQGTEGDVRESRRLTFDLVFAFVFIVALHGSSAFKIIVILYINYTLATKLRRSSVPFATWTFNIGILFANELCRGYPYASLTGLLRPSPGFSDDSSHDATHSDWGLFLDSYGGLVPRWEVPFNITVLRLISFNLDYYWSQGRTASSALEVCPPLAVGSYSS